MNFEVRLTGSMYVDKNAKRGLRLGQHYRSKDISVASLSDFEIKKSLTDKQIIVKKAKTNEQKNELTLTVVVPKSW